ncbi:ATP-binding protein [Paratractidigestivibacter sp.]|uniref:ATP-binding protein n=1 Tax=Paratractidigestivibacter sp. TaxID=2847316 RepID=UPI002ABE4EFF|nr:ATP-binding protein [Paratractidigestivibacter sp.]
MTAELGLASILGVLLCLTQPAELLLPALMITDSLPRRDDFRRRAVALGAAWGLCVMVATVAAGALMMDTGALARSAYSFFSSVAMLLAAIPTIICLYEASVWKAFFCVGAGYTIQNIASGLAELIFLLVRRLTPFDMDPGSLGDVTVSDTSPIAWLISAAIYIVVLAVAYELFIRRVGRGRLSEVEDRKMTAVLLMVILAVIAFDVVNKYLDKLDYSLAVLLVLRGVHGAVCLFVLFVQYEMLYSRVLEAQMDAERRLAAERERQYQLSRQNIDAINVKCHDIRHQIRALADGGAVVDAGALEDIAREVAVYDSLVSTGNEPLDTILSEKGLVCEGCRITLTCIADGSALGQLSPAEIYALFGNALDNAIRAVVELDDPERRSISVVVRRVGSLTSIHVENYYGGDLRFVDGMPQTTQIGDGHGFGTQSMRRCVEAHGGTLAFGAHDGVFTLDALLPAEN